jgi:predicted metalloprotease
MVYAVGFSILQIMQWKGRRESANVKDVRGQRASGGGGGLGLLLMVWRLFGIKGILAAAIVGGVLWKMGLVDPSLFMDQGGTRTEQVASSPEEEERLGFVKVVLADTEDLWEAQFARQSLSYVHPELKVFRGRVATGCGTGSAAMGPFYCPADQSIYVDLGFYDELARTFKSPGDFAQAYVVAHEVGHHVQKLLGVSDQVAAARGRPDFNEISVRLELQADYYAGVWAHHSKKYLDQGDIEEAMRAAHAIGDDAIQQKSQGRVVPHSFTHGTSAQRMRWFDRGLKSGKMEDGDTFSIPYRDL